MSTRSERVERELEERVRARVAELTAQRDAFVAQSNAKLMGYNAAIGELMLLIEPPEDEEGSAGESPPEAT